MPHSKTPDVRTEGIKSSSARPINILFLCTGNSARSILSEALVNELSMDGGDKNGKKRFIGWSAGSRPSGEPHPEGLAELRERGHRSDLYRSKSWDEFADMEAEMDIVVTVCDNAAAEICPVFPGRHIKLHWPAPDPAHIEPLEARQKAFADVYNLCRARIEVLVGFSDADLKDPAKLQSIAKITA